jgi:V/A-type H+-transporting ATPase subunit I
MAVMKMVALTMIGPDSEMEPVARQMVLTGGFQPLPLDLLVNDRNLRSKVTTETENPYDELLAKVTTVWKIAGEMIPDPSPVTLTKEFTLTAARRKVDQTSKRLDVWEKRRVVLSEEEELLSATKLFVEALKGTEFGPGELAGGSFLVPFFGRLSNENYQRLTESSEESPIATNELTVINGNTWVIVLTVKGYEESTRKLLEAVYFKEFSLKDIASQLKGADPLTLVNKRIANHQRAIKGLAKAAKDMLREHRSEYELLYSQLYTMQRVYDVCKGRGEVSGMFVLSGWIPADTLAAIKKTVEEEAPMTTVMIEETKEQPDLQGLPGYSFDVQPAILRRDRSLSHSSHIFHPLFWFHVRRYRPRPYDILRRNVHGQTGDNETFLRAGHQVGSCKLNGLWSTLRQHIRDGRHNPRTLAFSNARYQQTPGYRHLSWSLHDKPGAGT